jgi:Skp family chaperone for outer membrane proteins
MACLLAAGAAMAVEAKLGVFDFQRVSEETARGQELRANLEKFGDKKKGELAAKESELKTLEDQYKAQAFSLAPDRRAQMEKDLQKKQLDLQSSRESAQKEMQIEVNEAQGKFNEELIKVISAVGKERGYTLIFAKEQVAFASETVDITSEVIERFNKDSAKGAAPAAAPAAPAPAEKAPAPAPKKP